MSYYFQLLSQGNCYVATVPNSTYEWKNHSRIQSISISHFECCNQTHSVNKSQAIFGAHKSEAGTREREKKERKGYERRSTIKCEIMYVYVSVCVNKHAVRKISIFLCQNMHLFGECGLWPHSQFSVDMKFSTRMHCP